MPVISAAPPVVAVTDMPSAPMVTADLIENQRWDEITELCRKSREIVEEARK